MTFTTAVMSLFPVPPRMENTLGQNVQQTDESIASGLTSAEKQAMIDDLQLEITKRARGLRSIYNEQARQLRESLERRLHRIPPRMRSKTMGELADEQARKAVKPIVQQQQQQQSVALTRSAKRTSDAAFASEDKENAPTGYPDLQPQKKRSKLTVPHQTRGTENAVSTSPIKSVLSPRSHNSRTLPSKISSPEKPSKMVAPQQKPRPVSRAVSRQGAATTRKLAEKKPATPEDSEGRDSQGSTTSAKTTIVKRTELTNKRVATKKAPSKATTASTTRQRAPAARTAATAPAATRILRKRN